MPYLRTLQEIITYLFLLILTIINEVKDREN